MNSQQSGLILINDNINISENLEIESLIKLNNKAIKRIGCCDKEAEFYFQECLKQVCIDVTSHVPQQIYNTETNPNLPEHGEYDEGMNKFSDPMPIFSGLDFSAVIATILYNQGLLCLRQNRYKEAKEYFYSASCKLKASHYYSVNNNNGCVNMFQILRNVGLVQYRSARYQDALAAYAQAFQVLTNCKKTTNDPRCMQDLASTLNCLGVIYSQFKNADGKAVEVFNQSLAIRRELVGKDQDDKDIASTINNLGCVHFQNGDHVRALSLCSEALSIRVRLFGWEHIDVAASSLNVGQAHHGLGNLTEALEHYEVFVAVATAVLGEFHSDLTSGLKGIARIRLEQKNFDEAITFYRQALSVEKDGEEISLISYKIAAVLCEKGDLAGAIGAYNETLDLQCEVYGFNSLNVVDTLKKMSHVHKLRGEYDSCTRLLKAALKIQRKLVGNFHPNVSSTLSSIALICYETRNYEEALKVYQDVLQIQWQVFGRNHAHSAGTLKSIGHLFFYRKDYKMAVRVLTESLKVYRTVNDSNGMAGVLSDIASIHWNLGDNEKCLTHYSEALSTLRRALRCQRHMKLIPILKKLAKMCRQQGMLHESILYLNEAIEVLKINVGGVSEENDLAIAEILNEIGNVHLQRGEIDKMMLSFAEASRTLSLFGIPLYNLPESDLHFYHISKVYPECSPAA